MLALSNVLARHAYPDYVVTVRTREVRDIDNLIAFLVLCCHTIVKLLKCHFLEMSTTDLSTRKPAPVSVQSNAPFVVYFLLTIFYGCVNSLTSPALPDLATQANPDLSSRQLGALFIYRGFGSTIGAFLVGALIDKIDTLKVLQNSPGASHEKSDGTNTVSVHLMLVLCLVARTVCYVLMPLGRTLHQIGFNMAAISGCSNAIYVCGSCGLSKVYGKLLGSRVSLMDAAFGIGGGLAPVLAYSVTTLLGYPSAVESYRVLAAVDLVLCVAASILFWRSLCEVLLRNRSAKSDSSKAEELSLMGESRTGESKSPLQSPMESLSQSHSQQQPHLSAFWILIFFLLTFASDVCFSSVLFWFYTYATRALKLDDNVAKSLNSGVWVVFTSVQFLWAFLQQTRSVKPFSILIVIMPATILMCILSGFDGFSHHMSAIAPTVSSEATRKTLSCVGLVCLGVGGGLNALFIALLRSKGEISGKVFGLLRIASGCGNMVGASLVGFLEPVLGLSVSLPIVSASGMLLAFLLASTTLS